MTPEANASSRPNRVSATALSIVLLLVLSAILFGIYGPKIAGRLTLIGGVPLSDVVEAAASLRGPAVLSCMRQDRQAPLAADDMTPLLSRLLGRAFRPPDLSAAGYRLRKVSAASLPGAPFRSAELVYQRPTNDGDDRWLVLYLAADDGQFLSFDALGRSCPFMPNTMLQGELSSSSADESSALIWSDGPVLHLACVEDEQEAAKLRGCLDAR
jgi:hypothetical protein